MKAHDNDINREDPQIIDLENAGESRRLVVP